eukprot:79275-Prorocentrum_minimum.AAC.1
MGWRPLLLPAAVAAVDRGTGGGSDGCGQPAGGGANGGGGVRARRLPPLWAVEISGIKTPHFQPEISRNQPEKDSL